jgi:hypothetical protein
MHAPSGGVLKALLRGFLAATEVGRDAGTPLFAVRQHRRSSIFIHECIFPLPSWPLLALACCILLSVAAKNACAATIDTVADKTVTVLARAKPLVKRTVLLNDHKMTLVRIAKPQLPAAKVEPPVRRQAIADELAVEARRAAKWADFVSFSAVVHNGSVSELNWRYGDRSFHAYSNIDFRLLLGLSEIETDSAIFSWFSVPSDDTVDAEPALRQKLGLSTLRAEYVTDLTEVEMEQTSEAFAVLNGIHAYFDAHRAELIAKYEAQQIEQAAKDAAAEANPPTRPDTTVYLWKTAR